MGSWFCKREKSNRDSPVVLDGVGMDFKQFHETYKIISFAMVVGLIYPNEKSKIHTLLLIIGVILTVMPAAFMILVDVYQCWLRRDYLEIIRHTTILGPFMGGFLKMFIMLYKRETSQQLIDEVNNDYMNYNQRPEKHKNIIRECIRNNLKYSESWWTYTVVGCVMTFPIISTSLNIHSFLFACEPKKYMIHDLNRPFSEPETRFESPYFEIMYLYMFYCSIFYVINYLGYDGFYGLMINHACLKMMLFCQAVREVMKVKDKDERYERMVKVIHEQNRMFRFVELIQETFNIWLGIILIATMIQICNCVYKFTEGHGFDLRYAIFIVGTIVHIYLPCRYASKLKNMSIETSDKFYSSGWEAVTDQRIRKMLPLMIARGQKPLVITAFNMMIFDMELFVSILQTSYSMFTLLKS